MFFEFWDTGSGGTLKAPPYKMIYIEALSLKDAVNIFVERFDVDPYNVSCRCCGQDYSIESNESLEILTCFNRNAHYNETEERYIEEQDPEKTWAEYVSLEEYLKQPNVLLITL